MVQLKATQKEEKQNTTVTTPNEDTLDRIENLEKQVEILMERKFEEHSDPAIIALLKNVEEKLVEFDEREEAIHTQIQSAVNTLGENILTKLEDNQTKFLDLLAMKFGLSDSYL